MNCQEAPKIKFKLNDTKLYFSNVLYRDIFVKKGKKSTSFVCWTSQKFPERLKHNLWGNRKKKLGKVKKNLKIF